MRCDKCGSEVKEGKKFCTSCGAPVPDTPVVPLQQAAPTPPAPYSPTSGAPKTKRSRTTTVVVIAVIALLVVEATYRARFKSGGKGILRVTVTDSEDKAVINDSITVRSSDRTQKKGVKFHMTQSSGKPLEAKATLQVSKGQSKLRGSQTLSLTAVAGKGKELLLQEAKASATKKLADATSAVKEAAAMGVDTTDLVSMLSDATSRLEKARTAEQANEAASIADSVIAECAVRKASAAQAQAREADIAAARQVMFDYANAEKGNTESISLVDFSMNDARTSASGTYSGMVTVHTDPDNAGMTNVFHVTAQKQGGQWVVTDFTYEHVL